MKFKEVKLDDFNIDLVQLYNVKCWIDIFRIRNFHELLYLYGFTEMDGNNPSMKVILSPSDKFTNKHILELEK